jgi:predicted DNA-binding transcriptional regulator AlpA
MNSQAEYLKPEQLADLIGISQSTLAKMRMRGDGPPFSKIGRSVRYSRDASLAWMATRARRSTSAHPLTERRSRKSQRAATVTNAME